MNSVPNDGARLSGVVSRISSKLKPLQSMMRPVRKRIWPILKIVGLPLVTVSATATAWSLLPSPQIPPGFRKTVRPKDFSKIGVPVASSQTKAPQTSVAGPKPNNEYTSLQSLAHSSVLALMFGADPSTTGPVQDNPLQAAAAMTSKHLVALGDSITFGFGLKGANPATNTPSPDAYPYLVGKKEGWRVTDLGETGWTSQNLLDALKTKKFQKALENANVVTIDIGSNDLLHAGYNFLSPNAKLPAANAVGTDKQFAQALQNYANNLPTIIKDVQADTSAPIVLLNLYDPFPDGSSLHDVTEQIMSQANQVIWAVAEENQIPVVDVHSAFNHQQPVDVRLNSLDIHPTITGQKELAQLTETTMAHPLDALPAAYAVSPKGALIYSRATAGPFAIGWLRGNAGVLVTGSTGDKWRVVTPDGKTGYVARQAVTLLVRPFPNVGFHTQKLAVTKAIVSTTTAGKAAGFDEGGTTYAPVDFLAQAANGTLTVDKTRRTIDIETPMHSGLIQVGWQMPQTGASLPATSAATSAANRVSRRPARKLAVEVVPTTETASAVEGGWVLMVDGSAVNLPHPIFSVNGTFYVPAASAWSYLGGTVTPEIHALRTPSAGDSLRP